MKTAKKRIYKSNFRALLAQETKDRIMSSAHKLFESKGFEKVTIKEIAQEAEVATPTIYALFQSKIGILRALVDGALSHEVHETLVRSIDQETSPAKRFALAATIARQLYEAEKKQLLSLQNTAILDAELKQLEAERELRRYQRQEKSFKEMVQAGGLAQGLDEQKAQDVLWALTGRDFYRMLVIDRGWTPDDYESWLGDTLTKLLAKK